MEVALPNSPFISTYTVEVKDGGELAIGTGVPTVTFWNTKRKSPKHGPAFHGQVRRNHTQRKERHWLLAVAVPSE